jgi:DNA-binding transcriptional regulator of glucitol operon
MYINRPFHIVSEVGEKRFLDLVSNRGVTKTRNGRDTQVWRFDMTYRTLKNKGYSTAWSHSLDMRNTWMYVYGTGSQWHQLFRYNPKTRQFYNQRGKVMDINNGNKIKDQEGEYVGAADSNTNKQEQRWTIQYLDEMVQESRNGTGSMGFEINRPFYI